MRKCLEWKIYTRRLTFVDIGRVRLLAGALTLLLVIARGGRGLLRGSGRRLEMAKATKSYRY